MAEAWSQWTLTHIGMYPGSSRRGGRRRSSSSGEEGGAAAGGLGEWGYHIPCSQEAVGSDVLSLSWLGNFFFYPL